MNFVTKIKSSFPYFRKKLTPSRIAIPEISMSDREYKIYGEDKLTLQKLYEKWSCKDKWLLYDEGIPLLFGIEPGTNESLDDELSGKIEDLWVHAQSCVNKKLLFVLNTDKPEGEWEVRPVDLYSWATVCRIPVPDAFSTLMAFIVQTVKCPEGGQTYVKTEGTQGAIYQKHREIILGAATSLLINAPDLCENQKGEIVINQITREIIKNKTQWFGNDNPLLAESAMMDLINEYIKLTKPVV